MCPLPGRGTGTSFVPSCSPSQAAAREARAATGAQPSSEEGGAGGAVSASSSLGKCWGGVILSRGGLAEEGLELPVKFLGRSCVRPWKHPGIIVAGVFLEPWVVDP